MSDLGNFLQQQRIQYDLGQLDRKDLMMNPIQQFNVWFNDALTAKVMEVNAMNLATVDADGKPSSRIVLLKGVDENGFVFFTNYNSRKAKQLHTHMVAAINFFWPELQRQVRIEGTIKKVSALESDTYFQSRPRLSQLGAIASAQSEVIENREVLEKQLAALEQEYINQAIDRPTHWGGYILNPNLVEFWQGRSNRLHDRFQYSFQANGDWKIDRLSP